MGGKKIYQARKCLQ